MKNSAGFDRLWQFSALFFLAKFAEIFGGLPPRNALVSGSLPPPPPDPLTRRAYCVRKIVLHFLFDFPAKRAQVTRRAQEVKQTKELSEDETANE